MDFISILTPFIFISGKYYLSMQKYATECVKAPHVFFYYLYVILLGVSYSNPVAVINLLFLLACKLRCLGVFVYFPLSGDRTLPTFDQPLSTWVL